MFETATKYIDKLNKEKQKIEKQLNYYTGGGFRCVKNTTGYKWFEIDLSTKQRIYIPKSQRKKAEALAWRNYLLCRLGDIENELSAVNAYLKKHQRTGNRTKEYYSKNDGYKELIAPFFQIENDQLRRWAEASYPKCTNRPDELVYKAIDGKSYRSKSEVLLANRFTERGIAFRYECEFRMKNGRIVYPDFMIKHPLTGEIIIWEHFGMMDVDGYRNKNMNKLTDYANSGYYINHNLIVTMEGDGMHLDMEEVDRIIDRLLGL